MQYPAAENGAITKAAPNGAYAIQNAVSYVNSNAFKVVRRNGQVTQFNAQKIETAMTKAFFDVEGQGAADSARIHERVKTLTKTVETCLFRRIPEGGIIHIEDIQDQVELALMRKGEQKVARSYVIYREERSKLRHQQESEQDQLEPKIYVTDVLGKRKQLDELRLKTIVAEAVEGLIGVDGQTLYQSAVHNLFDGVPETDVSAVFIMAARVMIEKDPNYSFVAARLLQDSLRREALSFLNNTESEATLAEMHSLYSTYLEKTLNKAVDLELVDPELLRYDLVKLGAALQANRDQQFTYLGLQTLYDRYFIHSGNTRFELPQIFFMRVSMGLAINEENREERAIEFYNLLSSFDFMSSTPTLFNSGTLRPQLSSCYLTTISDDLDGIYNSIKDNALLSKFAGGLGNDWTQVRGLGAHIKGTNGQSQGVVPFLKVANDTAVAVNQCFAPETTLHTAEGIKAIRDVKQGDLVLGISGTYREVTQSMVYNQHDSMVEVDVKHSIKPTQVTSGHPFYAITNVPLQQANSRTMAWLEKEKIKPDWHEAGQLQKGDYIAQVIPTEIVPVKDFSEDDARLYGVLLGDGHLSKNKMEWGVSGNPKKDEHLEFVRHYLNERNIHFWETPRNEHYTQVCWASGKGVLRDATTGCFVSQGAATLPFTYDDLYNTQSEKRIARRFNHLPQSQTLNLLKGLLETDGCVSRGTEITFTSTSHHLAEGLRYQCLRLGVPTSGQYRERNNEHIGTRVDGTKIEFTGITKAFDIRIPAVQKIAELVNCKAIEKQNWLHYQGCIYSRIRSVKNIQASTFVFDLKVEGDESYMTTAGLAHNGGKRKGAVCAYLETWHIDIEEFLELRKNTGDERRRTHDMNSANWIPDLFMKRVAEEKEWTLFSPDETPELHELYGKAFETKYKEYEAKAVRGEMKLSKTIAALDLWRKMLGMLFETGHPWITFKDPCNIRYSNQHVGVVHSSNLCTEIMLHTDSDEIAVCFPKGTQILTKQGQKPIELCDQEKVLVPFSDELNPQQRFLTATLIPQGKKQVYEIITKNGISICATEEHPFLIQRPIDHDKPRVYEWRKLKELQKNDFIVCPLTPSIYPEMGQQDCDFTAAGWMLGDGWMSSSYGVCFAPHEIVAKEFVLPIVERWHQESPLGKNTPHSAAPTPYTQPNGVINWHTQRQGFIDYVKERFGFYRAIGPDKSIAPQIKYAASNQIASFLSGLFSADGCVLNDSRRKKGGVAVNLSSASLVLLKDVQLLLKPFGIHGRVRGCSVKGRETKWQGTYEIKDADSIVNFIRFIGFSLTPNKQEKLQALLPKLSSRSAFQHSEVVEIIAKGEEEVFDLSLAEDHSFIANGLVVHNCNLGSVNIAAHTTEDGLDLEKMQRTITTAMRMLDNVIDYNYYSVPQAKLSNSRHRPVGIGMMGFQDALYKQNIPYASEAAVEFADKSMEALSYFAIQTSNRLAVERGTYSTFEGSLWSQGILPIDSLDKLIEERGEYIQVDQSSTLDWGSLRSDIQATGMRNSNVMAIAPTATISNICGVSQSIEPTYQNMFVKSNLSGEFMVINAHMVNDLKALGIWDEVMINDLKYDDGSLQNIERIPTNLKEKYATAFEMDARWLIEAASRRQKWIDQGQSLNLYMSEPSGSKLDNLYKLAWVRGLKTTYYLRSMGATHMEKTTERTTTEDTSNSVGSEAPQACSILDPDCDACQ